MIENKRSYQLFKRAEIFKGSIYKSYFYLSKTPYAVQKIARRLPARIGGKAIKSDYF